MKIVYFYLYLLFAVCLYSADNSFITKPEYGAMLYENPRGIGCNKCHNDGKKSIIIAKYRDEKGALQIVKAPPINKIKFKDFKAKLRADKSESLIMPTYFLTNEEIDSLYYYITNLKR